MYGSYHANPINLQSMLAQATCTVESQRALPHAPITCSGELWYHEDGSFECEHAKVPADDIRTQSAIDATTAILIIEMAYANL